MIKSPITKLTMLNGMAGADFEPALDRHLGLNIQTLDLKDSIFGRAVEDLSRQEAEVAAAMIDDRGMTVHCLSTGLGNVAIEVGQQAWRTANTEILDRVLQAAEFLKPKTIRILAAFSADDEPNLPFAEHARKHPWIGAAYGELVGRIVRNGYGAVIENEAHRCIVTRPADAIELFGLLQTNAAASFIWDIQNMWEMGHPPNVHAFKQLLPILSAIHLKGGIAASNGKLRTASSLRQASWDVLGITQAAVSSGKVPVICLNPSHGEKPQGWDVWSVVQDDVAYLRENLSVA